jgi:Putative Actinobacterial Holin-X, holin superfamily III
MSNDLQTSSEQSVTGLLTGIVNDAQRLINQQLTLFQHELKKDVREAKEGLPALGIGLGVVMVAGILLGFTLVYLLALIPGLNTPDRLWACYAIVTAVFGIVGGVLLFTAVKKFEQLPMSEQAVEATKENVEWLTHPKQPK